MICESCGWTAAAVDSHGYSCCDYAALGVTFLAQERDALQQKLDEAVRLIEMRVDARHRPKPSGWAKQWTKNAEKWLATLDSKEGE